MAAKGEFSVTATGLNPRGNFVSLSPCEFQTWSCRGNPRNSAQDVSFTVQNALTVFAFLPFLDLAAKELREQLNTIADAEHRHAERENGFVRQRRVLGINARRPAGKNDALRLQRGDCRRRRVVAQDLRINVALADAPRNDLGVLRPEIQNNDLFSHAKSKHRVFAGRTPLGETIISARLRPGIFLTSG